MPHLKRLTVFWLKSTKEHIGNNTHIDKCIELANKLDMPFYIGGCIINNYGTDNRCRKLKYDMMKNYGFNDTSLITNCKTLGGLLSYDRKLQKLADPDVALLVNYDTDCNNSIDDLEYMKRRILFKLSVNEEISDVEFLRYNELINYTRDNEIAKLNRE